MNKNDDDTATGTTGLLGKFRERINKIRRRAAIKEEQEKEEQEKFIKEKVDEIKKEVAKNKNITKKGISKNTPYKTGTFTQGKEEFKEIPNNKNENSIENIDNSQLKEKKEDPSFKEAPQKASLKPISKGNNSSHPPKKDNINNPNTIKGINKTRKGINNSDPNSKIEELKAKIITKIKNDFSKKLAELEVLESELYDLKEQNEYELEIDKIKIIKEKINETIKKINEIIAEYSIYKKNYNLDNITDLNDSLLIDDIVEYKYLVESDALNKKLVKEYKLLEEYQNLYKKLDKIKEISDEIINENKEKISKLQKEELKHEGIKKSVETLDKTMNRCKEEINKQNDYLNKLMSKVNNITKEEIINYKFNLFNDLLNNSLLFISTISLNKKLPIIPRIFINTLVTNQLVRNLYQSMNPEKTTEIKYSAIDYDKEISSKINDIDYTSNVISDTLSTIKNIKSEFLGQYNSQLKGYTETLTKINKLEELVINNQYKVETIKEKLSKSRDQNQEKILKLENLKKNSQIN